MVKNKFSPALMAFSNLVVFGLPYLILGLYRRFLVVYLGFVAIVFSLAYYTNMDIRSIIYLILFLVIIDTARQTGKVNRGEIAYAPKSIFHNVLAVILLIVLNVLVFVGESRLKVIILNNAGINMTNPEVAWQVTTSKDKDFQISFPGQAKYQFIEAKNASSGGETLYTYQTLNQAGAYEVYNVSSIKLPKGVKDNDEEDLKKILGAEVKRTGGVVVNPQFIKHDNYTSYDFKIDQIKLEGKDFSESERLILMNDTLYTLQIINQGGVVENESKFFDSFKLLK